MACMPGELFNAAMVEAPVPFFGPLFITETVGARLWTKHGVVAHVEAVVIDLIDIDRADAIDRR